MNLALFSLIRIRINENNAKFIGQEQVGPWFIYKFIYDLMYEFII